MGAITLDGGVAVVIGVSFPAAHGLAYTNFNQAASGIGKETGLTFAEAGASAIVFADIDEAKIKDAAEESKRLATVAGYQALAIKVDVTNAESVQFLFDTAVKAFGRVDYCIDVDAYIPFNDSAEGTYDKAMDINAKGSYLIDKAAFKKRDLGRGAIVNVGSVLAYGAVPYKVGYVTSKHALLGITKVCAVEAGPLGIRVNMVSPSWVATPMFTEECQRAPPTLDFIKAQVPAGRPAEVGEVAEGITFLCSSAATYINGAALIIDSGLTLTVHLG
ncbi:hypothetical protein ACMFMF_002515 [Clarireedia jacksonii]